MAREITTAEELLRAHDLGRCELIRGELRMMIPPSYQHGRITMRLTGPILNHVDAHGLGTVVAAETGFLLGRDPDTVRAPDLAFVRASRGPGPPRGYFPGAPDLAVEVLSPDDRPGYVREKVAEWLEAGTRAVWVVDPRARTVTVHEARRDAQVLTEADTLCGRDVLPGFALAVREVFA
ncbi:MAG: Uma2 family endonuclease [Planctomycetota bacterium]|jgi:Uma2 family endonuclease